MNIVTGSYGAKLRVQMNQALIGDSDLAFVLGISLAEVQAYIDGSVIPDQEVKDKIASAIEGTKLRYTKTYFIERRRNHISADIPAPKLEFEDRRRPQTSQAQAILEFKPNVMTTATNSMDFPPYDEDTQNKVVRSVLSDSFDLDRPASIVIAELHQCIRYLYDNQKHLEQQITKMMR